MAQAPPPATPGQQKPPPNQKRPDALAPMRTRRFWITLAILFAANLLLGQILTGIGQAPTVTISYNAFLAQLSEDNVVSITSTGESITGVTKKAVTDSTGTSSTNFQPHPPASPTHPLQPHLHHH